MLRILLGMISTASLAALSAALSPALPSGSGTAVGVARPVSLAIPAARVTGGGSTRPAGAAGGAISPPVPRPGQVLPRGSLLNLSV
jgi:hypothetical protein